MGIDVAKVVSDALAIRSRAPRHPLRTLPYLTDVPQKLTAALRS